MLKLANDVMGTGSPVTRTEDQLDLSDLSILRGLLVSLEGSSNWFKAVPTLAKVDAAIAKLLPAATFAAADRAPLRLADMDDA